MRTAVIINLFLLLCVVDAYAKSLFNVGPVDVSGNAVSLSECVIIVDSKDQRPVDVVSRMFAGDLKRVLGKDIEMVTRKAKQPSIIIGTYNGNKMIADLVKKGKLNVDSLVNGYERFLVKVVDNPYPGCDKALVIAGSDGRGAAYGALTVSERMGVSPWYWWADVPVAKQDEVYVDADYVSDEPSIKYRGVFINDEDWGLKPWSATNFEKELGDIGPRTYDKVCELLLRLKGNMLAPAMHTCTGAFYTYPDNKVVADRYGIMITTSHCEPLLFNNASKKEWDKERDGDWNYKTNRDVIYNKLDARVKEAAPYENIYTVAMRGLHDEGMRGDMSTEEKIKTLRNAIMDQREILARHVKKPVETIPQIFVPYKEAQELYEGGLEVPDDVTLVWPDDNYGYMKLLSNEDERKRGGHSGIYYHLSYLGAPHDYLWICTTAPMLMYEELKKAYDTGADRYWLLNVGDIKPMELGVQTFFDMAWDIDDFTFNNVTRHQPEFLAELFGEEHYDAFKDLLDTYYNLAWSRKPEFMGWEREWDSKEYTGLRDTEFSFSNYNDAKARLADYNRISDMADSLSGLLDENKRAAFFEMVGYPVMGACQMNRKFLMSQLNHELASQGSYAEANWAAEQSRAANDSIASLTHRYNSMLDGKWNGMMSCIPPGYTALYQNMPELVFAPDAGTAEVNLAPVDADYVMERSAVIPLRSFDNIISDGSHSVRLLEGIGYDGEALQLGEASQQSLSIADGKGITVEYELPAIDADSVTVIVYTVPRFPLHRGKSTRYGVKIDDNDIAVYDNVLKEYSLDWKNDVLRNGTEFVSTFPVSKDKNSHRLSIVCEDPGLIVQRIILDWGGLKDSYVGPSATKAVLRK